MCRIAACVTLLLYSTSTVAADREPAVGDRIASELSRPLLDTSRVHAEFRRAILDRIPALECPDRPESWTIEAARLRERVLHEVVLRGTPPEWLEAKPAVRWLERFDTGQGYTIRKLVYEGYPGLWIPALLYEPSKLTGRVPAVFNTNGHVGPIGKAVEYKQIRCINLAKRGMLALNAEWIGMGQLSGSDYAHSRLAYLDLCGRSGLGVFYLSMKRALDVLLDHPHADPARLGVTGLSGGGWQTILISALDERVRLCAPNAGYIGLDVRVDHSGDVGDLEQNPVDLVRLADYTHLTAMLAPRPTLLLYNERDNCCFASARARSSVYEPIVPFYRLFDAAGNLVFHNNVDPGTHNYEIDNRQQFYRFVNRHWLPADRWNDDEIPCADELRTREALSVALPENNATFQSLALDIAQALPERPTPPDAERNAWRVESRRHLAEIVRFEKSSADYRPIDEQSAGPYRLQHYAVTIDDDWTLPATLMTNERVERKGVAIVVADGGRADAVPLKHTLADDGYAVVAIDVVLVGECTTARGAPGFFGQMLGTVGWRPLGVQAGQLRAVSRLAGDALEDDRITLVGVGPVSSVAVVVTAALAPGDIEQVIVRGLAESLKSLIVNEADYNATPSLFCFGLLESFDIRELTALVAPARFEIRRDD